LALDARIEKHFSSEKTESCAAFYRLPAKGLRTSIANSADVKIPWNKGKLVRQKAPLKPPEVWAIRVRLQLAENKRYLALFNLAVDSKL